MAAETPVVHLHVGAPKTGTTYLQQLLAANRESLAGAGVLFPGREWRDQVQAAQDVLGHDEGDPRIRAASAGAWERMAAEILSHRGPAVLYSMEFLSFAGREQARRVLDSLRDAEVHVVLTVRDATRTLPAQWQTRVHNGGTETWPEYLAGAAAAIEEAGNRPRRRGADVPPVTRAFHAAQGIPRMLRVWGEALPAGRLHVVTVPGSGADPLLLWRRFAEAVGVDPSLCAQPPARDNASLGYASAELVRRLNVALDGVAVSDYNPTLKANLALKVLAARAREEPRIPLDRHTRELAATWNRRVVEAITTSGADVVGDLADLPQQIVGGAADDADVDPPAEAQVLDAAAVALDGLRRLVRRRVRRLRGLGTTLDVPPAARDKETPGADRWQSASDPVHAAVAELADLARVAIDLHNQVRERR